MIKFGWLKAEDAAAVLTYLKAGFVNTAPPAEERSAAQALGG